MSRWSYPIPHEALDDRLAWTGTSGTGKTHDAGTAIEKVLQERSRACIVDPLGVWWGLRLNADGKSSGFNVVIFGGPHGDIAITESSGRLIGETVAGMTESCIVDLSEFDTEAAQRRFMLAFLVALYGGLKGDLLHLVMDEADMWAPQRIMDKEGDATKLHHNVQKIVRRGRVKGFIPWLITQRPAELSKSVLSQADGIIGHQLLAPQDVNALMDWVTGRADKATAETIRSGLPAFGRGQAVVYIPRRKVLEIAQFPRKVTFDSSRAPDRGEKKNRPEIQIKPLDINALKKRLEHVEAEAKANDPADLKAQIAALKRELATKAPAPAAATDADIRAAHARGVNEGRMKGTLEANVRVIRDLTLLCDAIASLADKTSATLERWQSARDDLVSQPSETSTSAADSIPAQQRMAPARPAGGRLLSNGDIHLTPMQIAILNALAWLESIGQTEGTRMMVAFLADSSPKSSTFEKYVSQLRSQGLIVSPSSNVYRLTDDGAAIADAGPVPLTHEAMMQKVGAKLTPGQFSIVRAVTDFYPGAISRADVASASGFSETSSTFEKYLSQARSLGLIEQVKPRVYRANQRLFP